MINLLSHNRRLRRFYAKFKSCSKCGKKIETQNGFWFWKYSKVVKGGFYHTNCGMINNNAPVGLLPF